MRGRRIIFFKVVMVNESMHILHAANILFKGKLTNKGTSQNLIKYLTTSLSLSLLNGLNLECICLILVILERLFFYWSSYIIYAILL